MIHYSLHRSVAPSAEPVTVPELKAHLRIDHTDDDAALAGLVQLGRDAVERDTGRTLVTQTWVLRLDDWPASRIELPRPPVQAVTGITYIDAGGDMRIWPPSEYVVDVHARPAIVRPAYGYSWPGCRGDERGIAVTYKAGYGDSGSAVPYELRHAVLLRCQLEYDGWNADALGTMRGAADAYTRIVQGLRVGVYP